MSILGICIKADAVGPVPEHSGTEKSLLILLSNSGICFFFIPVLLVVERHHACPLSILLVMERQPARPYCWWWKDTLDTRTADGGKTPCTSILLVVERQPARPYCWWWKDTLHVQIAGGGKKPCTSTLKENLHELVQYILLVVERYPACPYHWYWTGMHVHTAGGWERETPCMSTILLVVNRNTPCMSIYSWWWCVKLTLYVDKS